MKKGEKKHIDFAALKEILYFQSNNGCSLMIMNNSETAVIELTLKEVEGLLPDNQFYRIHRSYIVNIEAISELRYFRNQLLAVVQEYRIPVSRRRGRILMDNLDFL